VASEFESLLSCINVKGTCLISSVSTASAQNILDYTAVLHQNRVGKSHMFSEHPMQNTWEMLHTFSEGQLKRKCLHFEVPVENQDRTSWQGKNKWLAGITQHLRASWPNTKNPTILHTIQVTISAAFRGQCCGSFAVSFSVSLKDEWNKGFPRLGVIFKCLEIKPKR
jgi:hypothetical protein